MMQRDLADLLDHAVVDRKVGMRWAPYINADKIAVDRYTPPERVSPVGVPGLLVQRLPGSIR